MRLARTALSFGFFFCTTAALAQTPHAPTTSAIAPADLRARIGFLASDALRGRDTPSPGLEQAAAYIADEFRSYGLRPAGDSGTFIQRWPWERRQVSTGNLQVLLSAKSWNQPLKYVDDFFVLPGLQDSLSGAIYYAGVAAANPQALSNSARGQILVYYVPGKSVDEGWIGALRGTMQASAHLEPKGVVLLLDPDFGKEQIASVITNAAGQQGPFPVVGIRYGPAREWIAQSGANVDIRSAAAQEAVSSATITIKTRMETSAVRPPNVVGILEGGDPALRDTYVVFSAHMDHVGVGAPNAKGDSIFNGADDDASGTSAVLELAQAFAALPAAQRPKRSLLFLTVSGEEKGLFGSKHFVEHPPVPGDRIVADINLDMIGRNNPDTVVAIGQEYSTLGTTIQQVATAHPELKLTVAPDLWPQEQLFFRSDHFNFAAKNIPAIFFTTGLHPDYHQPSDQVETIDTDKLARIAQLIFHFGQTVASTADAPKWTEQGKAAMKRISGNE